MFICESCATAKCVSPGFSQSFGPCEVCDTVTACYDISRDRMPPAGPYSNSTTTARSFPSVKADGGSTVRKWLNCLIGRHEWRWWRNIHGDEINAAGGKRSVYRCDNCFRFQYRDALAKPEVIQRQK